MPPSIRRAVAAAETVSEVERLVATYGGMPDEEAAAQLRGDRAVSVLDGGIGMQRVAWPHYPGFD